MAERSEPDRPPKPPLAQRDLTPDPGLPSLPHPSVYVLVLAVFAVPLLPWALAHLRIDPAFGTGPVATITQDVLTIMIYFVVITSLMGSAA